MLLTGPTNNHPVQSTMRRIRRQLNIKLDLSQYDCGNTLKNTIQKPNDRIKRLPAIDGSGI